MGEIFVLVEHRQGAIREITFQMLWKADKLCRELKHSLTAVLIGGVDSPFIKDITEKADRVLVFEDERFKNFDADLYKEILNRLIIEREPFITLIGHTPWGMDLAPALAVKRCLPLATDCVDILIEDSGPKVI